MSDFIAPFFWPELEHAYFVARFYSPIFLAHAITYILFDPIFLPRFFNTTSSARFFCSMFMVLLFQATYYSYGLKKLDREQQTMCLQFRYMWTVHLRVIIKKTVLMNLKASRIKTCVLGCLLLLIGDTLRKNFELSSIHVL